LYTKPQELLFSSGHANKADTAVCSCTGNVHLCEYPVILFQVLCGPAPMCDGAWPGGDQAGDGEGIQLIHE